MEEAIMQQLWPMLASQGPLVLVLAAGVFVLGKHLRLSTQEAQRLQCEQAKLGTEYQLLRAEAKRASDVLEKQGDIIERMIAHNGRMVALLERSIKREDPPCS